MTEHRIPQPETFLEDIKWNFDNTDTKRIIGTWIFPGKEITYEVNIDRENERVYISLFNDKARTDMYDTTVIHMLRNKND